MSVNGLVSHTPPSASRSPSFSSQSGQVSDRDASMDNEEESAEDSDFEADPDDAGASSLSLSITVPALATPKLTASSTPWPFTSVTQTSPTLPTSPNSSVAARLSMPVIPASSLPHEILLHILRLLPAPSLAPALLVCKAWCQCGVELLWHKPSFSSLPPLVRMLEVINSPDQTFPYASFIRRLNFSSLHDQLMISDEVLDALSPCTRLERLTLAGCKNLGSEALAELLSRCPRLIALDLSDVPAAGDGVAEVIARHCPRVQGLNLSGCKELTDQGLEAIARGCPELRRIKLRNVDNITDTPIVLLSLNCPLLLEVDLVFCARVTDLALLQLFRTSHHLRELSLQACSDITDGGFPNHQMIAKLASRDYNMIVEEPPRDAEEPLVASDGSLVPRPVPLHYGPRPKPFDHLRYLDLTSLAKINDGAIAGLVKYMPKIRNLILAKCVRLTDEAVYSICQLGKHLHYLHLGHVSSITDSAVKTLARSCTRLRYIDLANCQQLTDMSVFELATNLPRLKRIGLVRVANITDQAIQALHARTSLERIHLSYCENLSVLAIHELLARLPRLTHLSLTGVPAFRRPDLQMWCRQPPRDFNSHQRATFCVYSGKGVHELRKALRTMFTEMSPEEVEARDPRNVPGAAGGGQHRVAARHSRALGAPPPQFPPVNPAFQIPPHNPRRAQPGSTHTRRGAPHPAAAPITINTPQLPTAPGRHALLPPVVPGRHPAPSSTQQVPIQYIPPSNANGPPTRAPSSSRTSAPPALASVQTAPDGWQWNQRTNTGSYALRSSDSTASGSASTSTQTPSSGMVASSSGSAAPPARRPRGATLTRGNYRGDEDMRERSDGEEDTSFGEEDVEMA